MTPHYCMESFLDLNQWSVSRFLTLESMTTCSWSGIFLRSEDIGCSPTWGERGFARYTLPKTRYTWMNTYRDLVLNCVMTLPTILVIGLMFMSNQIDNRKWYNIYLFKINFDPTKLRIGFYFIFHVIQPTKKILKALNNWL